MLYGDVIKVPDGRYYVKATRDDASRVMVQLNDVTMSDDNTITLPRDCPTITEIDETNVRNAMEKSVEWFGKEVSEKTLKSLYVPSVVDGAVSVSKATIGKKVVTRYFDDKKNEIGEDDIPVGSKCDVVLEFAGVWFMKKSYGSIWRLAQVRRKSVRKPKYPTEYLFDDEGQDESFSDEDHDDYV